MTGSFNQCWLKNIENYLKLWIYVFSEIEQGNEQPAGVFYFTHSEMLQQILLPLGIAKDQENLTAVNYEEMKTRLWRTSNITPFAANLVVVFFKWVLL